MNATTTPTDADLLREFTHARSEAAFTELVQRHAPLVLGVCRRVLNSGSDAEDAAQAVFLTLAQHASQLDLKQPLAPWLHRVAYRVALDAKRAAQTRTRHERESVQMTALTTSSNDEQSAAWLDLQPLLDEELNNLPEKYRVAVLLHHVEGKTQAETAEVLRQKPGTISMHLNRARELLRERLARKGVLLSAVGLGAMMSSNAKAAEVPAVFLTQTGKAGVLLASGNLAAAGLVTSKVTLLTQGATHMLFMAKFKAVASVWLVLMVLASVSGVVVYKAKAAETPQVEVAPKPTPAPAPTPVAIKAEVPEQLVKTQQGDLTLEVSSLKKSYEEAEDPRFGLRVTNVSKTAFDQPIKGDDSQRIQVDLKDLQTGTVSKSFTTLVNPVDLRTPGTAQYALTLFEDGCLFKKYSDENPLVLSNEERLEPGKYELTLRMTLPPELTAGEKKTFATQPLTFEIKGERTKLSEKAVLGGLAIQTRMTKSAYFENEPVGVKVFLTNATAVPLSFNGALQAPGISHWPFEVWIREASDNSVSIIPAEVHPDLKPEELPNLIELAPGETYRTTLWIKHPIQWHIADRNLARIVPTLPVGDYTLKVAAYSMLRQGQKPKEGVVAFAGGSTPISNNVSFEIKAGKVDLRMDPSPEFYKLLQTRKISFSFQDKRLIEAADFIGELAQMQIEVDPQIEHLLVNLRVSEMNVDLALQWIARLVDAEVLYKGERILIAKPGTQWPPAPAVKKFAPRKPELLDF